MAVIVMNEDIEGVQKVSEEGFKVFSNQNFSTKIFTNFTSSSDSLSSWSRENVHCGGGGLLIKIMLEVVKIVWGIEVKMSDGSWRFACVKV